MKPGRNGPCPCGSGAKYKKCCLPTQDTARPRPEEAPVPPVKDDRVQALDALTAYSTARSLLQLRDLARLFGLLEPLPDAVTRSEVELKFYFHLHFDVQLRDGRTIAETFLDGEGRALPPRQHGILRSIAAARMRVYEVLDVRVDEGVSIQDLWTDEEVWVYERLGSRQLERWDLLGARVVIEEDGSRAFDGGLYRLPPEDRGELLSLLRKAERQLRRRGPVDDDLLFRHFAVVLHGFWLDAFEHAQAPRFVTAEGDPMAFGKIVYDVRDRAALLAALEGCDELAGDAADGYRWIEETRQGFTRTLGGLALEGGRLTLEVTSRRRGERGRALLEKVAGVAIRHRSTRYESVEEAMARREVRSGRAEAAIDPAEAPRLLVAFKERHYRTWADTPLPALGGRTPRHAARLKTWRARLVEVLKGMENREASSATRNAPGYDFEWLWLDLGLERPLRQG